MIGHKTLRRFPWWRYLCGVSQKGRCVASTFDDGANHSNLFLENAIYSTKWSTTKMIAIVSWFLCRSRFLSDDWMRQNAFLEEDQAEKFWWVVGHAQRSHSVHSHVFMNVIPNDFQAILWRHLQRFLFDSMNVISDDFCLISWTSFPTKPFDFMNVIKDFCSNW